MKLVQHHELMYNKYDIDTLEHNIDRLGLKRLLTTQKLTTAFCVKYLLNPEDKYSPYYLFSTGTNLIDGEEIDINEFLGNFRQRLNYGIGIGITIKNIEFEILYGKYNYQIIGVTKQKEDTLYSSNKLTFNCKYRF